MPHKPTFCSGESDCAAGEGELFATAGASAAGVLGLEAPSFPEAGVVGELAGAADLGGGVDCSSFDKETSLVDLTGDVGGVVINGTNEAPSLEVEGLGESGALFGAVVLLFGFGETTSFSFPSGILFGFFSGFAFS